MIVKREVVLCAVALCAASWMEPAWGDRTVQSLNGSWQFRREGSTDVWREVQLPTSFEEHEGIEFDGVGIYRKEIPAFELPAGMRVLIHFQAVATLAEVSFNGDRVGSHLGGWTPFRVDVTAQVRAASPGEPHELLVRVDEMVGHNSQGFLPIVAPHFGGIWQDVELVLVPELRIDDLQVLVHGDVHSGQLRVEVPYRSTGDAAPGALQARYRLRGHQMWSAWHPADPPDVRETATGTLRVLIPVTDWQRWTPSTPHLYEVEIALSSRPNAEEQQTDRVRARGAFRSMRVDGHRLVLNDQPLSVRGLLNWGYAPPRVAPSIDEAHFRTELELAKSLGFNLMKFCLWVPPKRYLELVDEMGMLAWVEYPTWHSKWTPDQLPTLEPEFTEFFCFDRNHPSVVLRSLTCETGPSADLGVIQTLYDRCHAMVPDAVVVDDSSWIGWNRVHDFYDDHPYGNNHTWVATLNRLKQYIAERTPKPLVLGEAIAADTWPDHAELLRVVGDERPFWLPRSFDGNLAWMDAMGSVAGHDTLSPLEADSKHYGLLMRKYQIEAYRREIPSGGYVVSVIRDVPLCSMGFNDFLGRSKWSADEWIWHGDTMLLLETDNDRRSYAGGETVRAQLYASHFGPEPIEDGGLTVSLMSDGTTPWQRRASKRVSLSAGEIHPLEPWLIQLPDVERPERFTLSVELSAADRRFTNRWSLWVVPAASAGLESPVHLHESCGKAIREIFPHGVTLSDRPAEGVVVTARLDLPLVDFLLEGGRVMVLPDGEPGSFPLRDEWFLRGAPHIAHHPLLNEIPRELLLELQHFDLAGPVIPDISYLEEITPILSLWNNHDLERVKTQGLVFETRVGQGRMLVSALRHNAECNAAGPWLARLFARHLATGAPPSRALSAATVNGLRAKIDEKRLDLTEPSWRFLPDPDNMGLERGWHLPSLALDDTWKPIRIGRAWEGQGYPTLDGWAWYRLEVDIPPDWDGREAFVSFTGVDDYYELFVNGVRVGSGGDLETRTTAFEERKSHAVSDQLVPGKSNLIVVRVHDWHGAGGIFRPVHIGTVPLGGAEMLQ